MIDLKSMYSQSQKQILKQFNVQQTEGLNNQQVLQNQKKFGFNTLTEEKSKSVFKLLLEQLNDALIYVLLGAVMITLFLGEWVDAIIILVVVILNAVLGVYQEMKAGNAIAALKQLSNPHAIVKRNGQTFEINTSDLVPGDLVILEAGRNVPADIRIIEAAHLQIDESALTGESVASPKTAEALSSKTDLGIGDLHNMAFMSTLVTYGRGVGVVVGTGNSTEIGKIATIISEEEDRKTPLEIQLSELGKTLGKIAIGVCALMFGIGYFQGREVFELFMTSVSLAVASIPEGLAAIVAIVLSVGVTKLARQNSIVKKLPAVETLGSVSVICSDKTGTLTQNKMTVTQFYTFSDALIDDFSTIKTSASQCLAKGMFLASDATLEDDVATGDPTEIALLMFADDLKLNRQKLTDSCPRIGELPFDSERKMMSTCHLLADETREIYVKGALDSILLRSKYVLENDEVIPLTDVHRMLIQEASEKMSDHALRTLALAYKRENSDIPKTQYENDLILVGVVGMMDPPRLEVKDAINEAKQAGIMTVMITGDHKNTAMAIAKELGIATDNKQAISGVDLRMIASEKYNDTVTECRVFARVSPEDKVNIVKAFQSKGNIVSMTGDGVNDAPSLNAADIGVAMGITGTDVAKSASDMILADDNFSTIVNAIEQGRIIFNNIKKSVLFLLSSNLGEVITMLIAVVAGMPMPLIATQLLWINLITDSLPALALGLDSGSTDVMKEQPRKLSEGFFANGGAAKILIAGVLIGLVTIFGFWHGYNQHGYSPFDSNVPQNVLEYARTLAFMTLVSCQLFMSLSYNSIHHTILNGGLLRNKYLIGAVVVGFLMQTIVLYIPFLAEAFHLQPLHGEGWLWILGLGLIPMLLNELVKLFRK